MSYFVAEHPIGVDIQIDLLLKKTTNIWNHIIDLFGFLHSWQN